MLIVDKRLLVYFSNRDRYRVKGTMDLATFTLHHLDASLAARPNAFQLVCASDSRRLEETVFLSATTSEDRGACLFSTYASLYLSILYSTYSSYSSLSLFISISLRIHLSPYYLFISFISFS